MGQCRTYGLNVLSLGSLGRHDGGVCTRKRNQVSLEASLLFVGCFVDAVISVAEWPEGGGTKVKAVRMSIRRENTKALRHAKSILRSTLDCTQLQNCNAQNWNITTSRPNYE